LAVRKVSKWNCQSFVSYAEAMTNRYLPIGDGVPHNPKGVTIANTVC